MQSVVFCFVFFVKLQIKELFFNCSDIALPIRSRARRFRLIGLFPQAHVVSHDGKDELKGNLWCSQDFCLGGAQLRVMCDKAVHGQLAGCRGWVQEGISPSHQRWKVLAFSYSPTVPLLERQSRFLVQNFLLSLFFLTLSRFFYWIIVYYFAS